MLKNEYKNPTTDEKRRAYWILYDAAGSWCDWCYENDRKDESESIEKAMTTLGKNL